MRKLLLSMASLLSVWGCAPPPQQPAPQPVAAVSPTATTNAFDGIYHNPVGAPTTVGCPNVTLPPFLRITNGLAVWQGPNLTFQGYVTPQGVLAMSSGSGQTFQGQIDSQFVLRAHVAGPNCAYDIILNRST
jgi:hypothetical protein